MKIITNIVLGLLAGIGFIALCFGIAVICAIPTWLLWNWLMPVIFGLKTITLLQALGMNFLSAILFKSSNSSSSKE